MRYGMLEPRAGRGIEESGPPRRVPAAGEKEKSGLNPTRSPAENVGGVSTRGLTRRRLPPHCLRGRSETEPAAHTVGLGAAGACASIGRARLMRRRRRSTGDGASRTDVPECAPRRAGRADVEAGTTGCSGEGLRQTRTGREATNTVAQRKRAGPISAANIADAM